MAPLFWQRSNIFRKIASIARKNSKRLLKSITEGTVDSALSNALIEEKEARKPPQNVSFVKPISIEHHLRMLSSVVAHVKKKRRKIASSQSLLIMEQG